MQDYTDTILQVRKLPPFDLHAGHVKQHACLRLSMQNAQLMACDQDM